MRSRRWRCSPACSHGSTSGSPPAKPRRSANPPRSFDAVQAGPTAGPFVFGVRVVGALDDIVRRTTLCLTKALADFYVGDWVFVVVVIRRRRFVVHHITV